MKKEFENELSPEVKAKMKKNIVYVSIFSIIMVFAGLTSAYIVSMGDSFWLKTPFPTSFWISTFLIFFSSIFIEFSIRSSKNKNTKGIRIGVCTTMGLGIAFVFFQFKGYGELINNGVYATQNHILVNDGRYGEKFEIIMDDQYIKVDGNNYFLGDKKLTKKQFSDLKNYMNQFEKIKRKKPTKFKEDKRFKLLLNEQFVSFKKGTLYAQDTIKLVFTDLQQLKFLALNIRAERGDFFVKGQIGKDFQIYFKGEELTYKNRMLYRKNGSKPLPETLQRTAIETADSASSYLYIITFIHLLHIIFSLFYLLRLNVKAFKGAFDSGDYLKLKLGAIFWHFLGVLWLYLVLFLLFIH